MAGKFLLPSEIPFIAGCFQEGGEHVTWSLLYDGKPNRFDLRTFHDRADQHGPLIAIATSKSGWMFGACTRMRMASDDSWMEDKNALLFRLRKSGGVPSRERFIANDGAGIFRKKDFGLCFGFQNKPQISFLSRDQTLFVEPGISSFQLNDVTSLCGDDRELTDLKLYRIDDVFRTLLKPWRTDIIWSKQTLDAIRKDVEQYRPIEATCVTHVNILLLGPIKAGKSSFFNSTNSAIRRIITGQANAGSAIRSLTTKFRKYPVRLRSGGEPLNFRLCDSMGLEDDQGMEAADCNYILDGYLKDGYVFNPRAGISHQDPKYKSTPTLKDQMHVVVMVVDVIYIRVCSRDNTTLGKLRTIRNNAAQRGIPILVLLTKADLILPEYDTDMRNVYRCRAVAESVQLASNLLGVPKKDIMVVKNYDSETDCQTDVDLLILSALRQMLWRADDFLDNEWDKIDPSVP